MDDLTQRLRGACYLAFDDGTNDYATAPDAAARIEALEAEVARLRGAVQKIAEADDVHEPCGWAIYTARAAPTPPHAQHTAGVDATAPTSGC